MAIPSETKGADLGPLADVHDWNEHKPKQYFCRLAQPPPAVGPFASYSSSVGRSSKAGLWP